MAGSGEDNHSTGSSCGSKRASSSKGAPLNQDCRSTEKWSKLSTAKCTICSNPIRAFFGNEIQTHPFIGVLVCKRCFKYLTDSGSWTQDANGKDEHCRWCGEGGNIIECDYCPHGFCTSCIKRNLGRTYVDNLKANIDNDPAFQFKCFCCEAAPLQKLHDELTHLRNVILESRRKRTSNSASLSSTSGPAGKRVPESTVLMACLKEQVKALEQLNIDLQADADRAEQLKLSRVTQMLYEMTGSFRKLLEVFKSRALKEEDDKDFRYSRRYTPALLGKNSRSDNAPPKKGKRSVFFQLHQAMSNFTDGFIATSVLVERFKPEASPAVPANGERQRKSRKRPKIEPPGSDVRDEQIKPVNFPEAIADDAENLPIVKVEIPDNISDIEKEAAIEQAKRESNTANASESIILRLDSDSAHDEEPLEVDRAPNASKSKNQRVKRSAVKPLSSKVAAVVCSDSDDGSETFAKRVRRSMEERSKKSDEPAGNKKQKDRQQLTPPILNTPSDEENFDVDLREIDREFNSLRGTVKRTVLLENDTAKILIDNESVADVKKGRGKKNASGQSEKDSAEGSASCTDVDEAEVEQVAKKRVKQEKPGDLSFV